jgi:hypothetical protein
VILCQSEGTVADLLVADVDRSDKYLAESNGIPRRPKVFPNDVRNGRRQGNRRKSPCRASIIIGIIVMAIFFKNR